jgi:hypothetical protein
MYGQFKHILDYILCKKNILPKLSLIFLTDFVESQEMNSDLYIPQWGINFEAYQYEQEQISGVNNYTMSILKNWCRRNSLILMSPSPWAPPQKKKKKTYPMSLHYTPQHIW